MTLLPLLFACTSEKSGTLDYVLSNTSIDLGSVTYETEALPTWTVTVQNNMAVTMTMLAVGITGSPEDLVVFQYGSQSLVQIGPDSIGSVAITVSADRMSTWENGNFQWALDLNLSAELPTRTSGGLTDTAAYGPATEHVEEALTLPIYLRVDCDLDGDGVQAEACEPSGGDCNDRAADVLPGALELCDAADNDCDGSVDEGVSCGDSG